MPIVAQASSLHIPIVARASSLHIPFAVCVSPEGRQSAFGGLRYNFPPLCFTSAQHCMLAPKRRRERLHPIGADDECLPREETMEYVDLVIAFVVDHKWWLIAIIPFVIVIGVLKARG